MGGVINTDTKETDMALLESENRRLRRDEKMFRLLCETSNSAFIYYNYREDRIRTIANWDYFFDFSIENIKDFSRLYDKVEEKYAILLREGLFIENHNRDRESFEIQLKEKNLCVEVEVNIVYDADRKPTDKIIRFKDVTKINAQKDELTYMAYYDILTGLYNRNCFVRILGELLRKATREMRTVAVMFVDFDDSFRQNIRGMNCIE